MSSTSLTPADTPQRSPEASIWDAVDADSPTQLEAALNILRSLEPSYMPDIQRELSCAALQKGSVPLTEYLLSHGYTRVEDIRPTMIRNKVSIPLLEVLLAYGWDINTTGAKTSHEKGMSIVDEMIDDENIVVWLVEHGARVDGGEVDAIVDPKPPALLEMCAARGSLKTFRFLRERGAKLGKRTLHVAALRAANIGADPARDNDGEESDGRGNGDGGNIGDTEKRNIEALLRYLVDELKLDVNQAALDIPWFYGTPINHAAARPRGAAVVRWLLQKGADPHKFVNPEDHVEGSISQRFDAEAFSRMFKCDEVLAVLLNWRENSTIKRDLKFAEQPV